MATVIKHSVGDRIDYTPGSDVAAGDVVVLGDIVGVSTAAIASGKLGALDVEGVFEFPKGTGSGSALTAGTKVYWAAASDEVTTSEGSNKVAGYVVKDAAVAATSVLVKLAR